MSKDQVNNWTHHIITLGFYTLILHYLVILV